MEAGFTFTTHWHEQDAAGLVREYADQHFSEDLQEARRLHADACRGMWVKRGTLKPHVSALRVRRKGRLLAEELAPPKDLPEFGQSAPPELGPDPRTDPQLRERLGLILKAGRKDAA